MIAQKIDVLSAMSHAATELQGMSPPMRQRAQDLREALAAVAALIEAHHDVIDAQFGLAMARYNGVSSELYAADVMRAELRLSAAIARIGGAK